MSRSVASPGNAPTPMSSAGPERSKRRPIGEILNPQTSPRPAPVPRYRPRAVDFASWPQFCGSLREDGRRVLRTPSRLSRGTPAPSLPLLLRPPGVHPRRLEDQEGVGCADRRIRGRSAGSGCGRRARTCCRLASRRCTCRRTSGSKGALGLRRGRTSCRCSCRK